MYTFIGDCHGKTKELVTLLGSGRIQSSYVLQLGDMGLGFRGVTLPNLDKDFGFIRGNHDQPDLCRMHNNYAGEFGMWNGVFVIGGAYSIDWMHRVPGKSWWFDEEQSEDRLGQALAMYTNLKPRIVASHEAPQSVAEALLNDADFRPEKWGSTGSRTATALQRMLNHHQPEQWFFGHYHRDWQAELGGTKFQCLNELSTKTI